MNTEKMPIITMQNLYHVGYFNPAAKRKGSYEGSGLSISTEPDAWRKINPSTCGHTFKMEKQNNQFLDYYALTEAQEAYIYEWGVSVGYVMPTKIYKHTYFDDEMGCDVYNLYDCEHEVADLVADYDEDINIEELDGFYSTEKMDLAIMSNYTVLNPLDLLTTLYAQEVLNIDGVYWFEILDVFRYSAPRGVIAREKLNTWKAVLINQ